MLRSAVGRAKSGAVSPACKVSLFVLSIDADLQPCRCRRRLQPARPDDSSAFKWYKRAPVRRTRRLKPTPTDFGVRASTVGTL